MSAPDTWRAFSSGNLMLGPLTIDVAVARWGGGAEPGRYHVFAGLPLGLSVSQQCVVDDFGNLVEVH